jgi:hypothetical protein
MTIAAGFVTGDGIVICADTQETYGELLKINVPKILIKPEKREMGAPRVVSAGAGNGSFIEKLANEAQSRLSCGTTDLDCVCAAIEQTFKDTFEEFGRIFQQGAVPNVDMIFGVASDGKTKLFRAIGPVVNPVEKYASVGIWERQGG